MTGTNHIERPIALRPADLSTAGTARVVHAMPPITTHARRWTFVDRACCGTGKPSTDLTIGASSGPKTWEGDSGTREPSV